MTAVFWTCSYVHDNSSVSKGSTLNSMWGSQSGGSNWAACSPSPSLRPWKDHSTPPRCICFRHGIWGLPSSIWPPVPEFVQATSCPLGASMLSFQRLGNIPVYRYATLSPLRSLTDRLVSHLSSCEELQTFWEVWLLVDWKMDSEVGGWVVLFLSFWERVLSCSLSWPQTYFTDQAGRKTAVFLPWFPKSRGYRHVLLRPAKF